MALTLEPWTISAVTISTAEVSLTGGTTTIQTRTTVGFYYVRGEVASIADGDVFELAEYEKTVTGGTQRKKVVGNVTLAANGSSGVFEIVSRGPMGIGVDYTIRKVAGTDRAVTARTSTATAS